MSGIRHIEIKRGPRRSRCEFHTHTAVVVGLPLSLTGVFAYLSRSLSAPQILSFFVMFFSPHFLRRESVNSELRERPVCPFPFHQLFPYPCPPSLSLFSHRSPIQEGSSDRPIHSSLLRMERGCACLRQYSASTSSCHLE